MSSVLCINKQDLINKIAVERAMNYTEDLNIAYEILNGGSSSNSVFNGSTGASFVLTSPRLFTLLDMTKTLVDTSDVIAGSGYMQIKPYFLQLGLGRVNYTLSGVNNDNSDLIGLYSGIITDFTPNSDGAGPTPLNYLSYETVYQLKDYVINNNNNKPLLTSSTTTNTVSDSFDGSIASQYIEGSSTIYNYNDINGSNLLKDSIYLSYPTIISCNNLSNFTNYYVYEDGVGFNNPNVSSNSILAFSPTLTTAPSSSSFMDFISYLNNILNTSTLLTWNNLGLSSLGIILEDSPNGELEIGIYIPIQPTFNNSSIGSKIGVEEDDKGNISNGYLLNPYRPNKGPGNGVLGLYNDSVASTSNTNIYAISNSLYLINTWNGFEKAIIKHVIDLYSPEI